MSSTSKSQLKDLIVVAGHAAFRADQSTVPPTPEADAGWVLQSFQLGEPPFYIEHIRRGVVLAANNPRALLLFSGGHTRQEAGDWSEASTYLAIARHYDWWVPANNSGLRMHLSDQTDLEEFARDSFENLLFSVCRFQTLTGRYPETVTVVSWAFKRTRFDFHRAAIGFPAPRYRFDPCNEPLDLPAAIRGEQGALRDFIESRYGADGKLFDKRNQRDIRRIPHPYRECPSAASFFDFIHDPANKKSDFTGDIPWA
jgi:hypothetical protein